LRRALADAKLRAALHPVAWAAPKKDHGAGARKEPTTTRRQGDIDDHEGQPGSPAACWPWPPSSPGRPWPQANDRRAGRPSTVRAAPPNSQIAFDQQWLHNFMLVICLVIFIAVFGVMFCSVVRHRKSKGVRSNFTRARRSRSPGRSCRSSSSS
jgi:hypothetical protein